jgi:GNAT superfamily N-acetyltransferase
MSNSLTIRPASPSEAPLVAALLAEVAQGLHERGIQQWDPAEFTPALVAQWQTRGDVLLAWQGAVVVGTVALTRHDEPLWHDVPTAAAAYLHKLAIRRSVAGQGISHALLRASDAWAIQHGARVIRLDCWAGNTTLRQFYANAGYTLHSITIETLDDDAWECARFEKRL